MGGWFVAAEGARTRGAGASGGGGEGRRGRGAGAGVRSVVAGSGFEMGPGEPDRWPSPGGPASPLAGSVIPRRRDALMEPTRSPVASERLGVRDISTGAGSAPTLRGRGRAKRTFLARYSCPSPLIHQFTRYQMQHRLGGATDGPPSRMARVREGRARRGGGGAASPAPDASTMRIPPVLCRKARRRAAPRPPPPQRGGGGVGKERGGGRVTHDRARAARSHLRSMRVGGRGSIQSVCVSRRGGRPWADAFARATGSGRRAGGGRRLRGGTGGMAGAVREDVCPGVAVGLSSHGLFARAFWPARPCRPPA